VNIYPAIDHLLSRSPGWEVNSRSGWKGRGWKRLHGGEGGESGRGRSRETRPWLTDGIPFPAQLLVSGKVEIVDFKACANERKSKRVFDNRK